MDVTTPSQPDRKTGIGFSHLGLLPVVLSVALVVVFRVWLSSAAVFEPHHLLAVLNAVFLALMPFTVAYLAGRSYVTTGSLNMLLIGCALLVFGAGNLVAGWTIEHPGPNSTVTIHNVASLVASVFYIVAAFVLAEGTTEGRAVRRLPKLLFAYFAILLFVVFLSVATIFGLMPLFFVVGRGPTPLRELVLTVAVILHVLSAIFALRLYRKRRMAFLYWYGLAIFLIATGLAAVLMQTAVGSPIGWVGRIAQYLGGIYLLAAAIVTVRQAHMTDTSVDKALASFFRESELHYRKLVETAKVAIISTDSRGQVLLWNPAAEELFGYARREAVGSGLTDLVGLDRSLIGRLDEAAPAESRTNALEIALKRKDGSALLVEISAWAAEVADGTAVTFVIRDITERKRIEEELRQVAETFERTFQGNAAAMALSRLENGRLLDVNERWLELTGFRREEAIGKTAAELRLWKNPEDRNAIVRKIQQQRSVREWECTCLRKNGQEWTALFSAQIISVRGEQALITSARDVTARKRAEEALQESEEKFRLLFESMTEGVALHEMVRDVAGSAVDYRILDVNPAFVRQTGIPRERANSALASELYGAAAPPYLKEYEEVVSTGKPLFFETYFPPMKKHFAISAMRTKSNRFATVFLDITDRKQAEETVQTTLQRFYAVLSSMYTGLLLVTDESRVEFANQAFCDYFDLNDSPAELVGLTSSDIFARIGKAYLYPDEAIDRVREIMDKGQPVKGEEVAMRGERGLLRDFIPIRIGGKSYGRLWYHTDITERKLAEEALKRAHDELELRVEERTRQLSQAYEKLQREMSERERLEAQLRQAQKMEAVGTLAGGIAHDFNNMLAVIIGNAELAMDDIPEEMTARHNLDQIFKAAMRARGLVRQILTFSRKTEHEHKPIPLTPLVNETFKLLRASLPTTIEMLLNVETSSDMVLADPVQIQQVLMNLCTNAADAMRSTGGRFEVTLADRVFTEDGPLPEAGMQPGTYVTLTVSDTGPGMDEDVKSRIFEPFFTTKERGQGTGMGLAVVYGIVKSHQGVITVLSQPRQGSTFTVYLPHHTATEKMDEPTSRPVPKGKERILFVDDEEILVEMAEGILDRLGYKVVCATGSADALQMFTKDPQAFDLVITDHTMPEMTGAVLAQKLKEIRPDIPLILCTGYSETISQEKAESMGIHGFVMKPLSKNELAEIVRRVLDRTQVGV